MVLQIRESASPAAESEPDSFERGVVEPDSAPPFTRGALESGVTRRARARKTGGVDESGSVGSEIAVGARQKGPLRARERCVHALEEPLLTLLALSAYQFESGKTHAVRVAAVAAGSAWKKHTVGHRRARPTKRVCSEGTWALNLLADSA